MRINSWIGFMSVYNGMVSKNEQGRKGINKEYGGSI